MAVAVAKESGAIDGAIKAFGYKTDRAALLEYNTGGMCFGIWREGHSVISSDWLCCDATPLCAAINCRWVKKTGLRRSAWLYGALWEDCTQDVPCQISQSDPATKNQSLASRTIGLPRRSLRERTVTRGKKNSQRNGSLCRPCSRVERERERERERPS